MKPNTQTQNTVSKKPSTGSSKTGAILSVLALILSAMGSALVHSKYKADVPINTVAEKAGEAVTSGTWRVLATIFSIPLLIGGLLLGGLAILLTLIRLGKVKVTGLLFSVLWIFLGVWAIKIAIDAFQVIKAH
jgi:hypothetical protein